MKRLSMFMAPEGAGGAGGAGDWKAALPEEQRGAAYLQDVKDLPTLVKNYGEALAYRGQSIRIPGPDAAPEARKEFVEKLTKQVPDLVMIADGDDDAAKAAREAVWQRLGKPKDAKEYSLAGVELVPGVQFTPEEQEALRATATRRGYTKAQFKAFVTDVATDKASAAKAVQDAKTALKGELGAAFDERTATVAATVEKLGFPAHLVQAVRSGAVDVATFKALAAVAKGFGEQREIAGQGGGAGGKLTPAEAKAQRAELRGRKEFWDRSINAVLSDQLRARDLELAKAEYPE
jgi:hypothetical protein